MTIDELQTVAAKIRVETLKMLTRVRKGCATSCMGVVDLLVLLYFGRINEVSVMRKNLDYLIFANVAAIPSYYVTLSEAGYFPRDHLYDYGSFNALLSLVPNCRIPGITLPCESNYHGLSAAVGFAQSLMMEKKSSRVYVIVSDEQLQNGQFWEAAMAAAHYKLENLFLLVDRSGCQADGTITHVLEIDPLYEKFEYYGWRPFRVVDGHNYNVLLDNLARAWLTTRKPTVLICRTVKGKGIPFAEGKYFYQGLPLSSEELEETVLFLEKTANLSS